MIIADNVRSLGWWQLSYEILSRRDTLLAYPDMLFLKGAPNE